MNQSIVDDKNKTGYCKCKSFIIPLFSDSGRNDSLRFNPSFLNIFMYFLKEFFFVTIIFVSFLSLCENVQVFKCKIMSLAFFVILYICRE